MFSQLQKGVREALDLPEDVLGDCPRISIVGRSTVIVENFREIITFSGEEIRLETGEGELCLNGERFILRTLLPTEMRVEGKLTSLSFRGGEA